MNVFDSEITIPMAPLEQDLSARGRSRLLSQFGSNFPGRRKVGQYYSSRLSYWLQQGLDGDAAEGKALLDLRQALMATAEVHEAPVFAQIMDAVGAEFDAMYSAGVDAMDGRTLAHAEGVNLDMLGTLVGQSRSLYAYGDVDWLTPDESDMKGADNGVAWVDGAELYGRALANDSIYRRLILMKIFKNHAKYASVPEIRSFLRMVFGFAASFVLTGIQSVMLAVGAGSDMGLARALIHILRTKVLDHSYGIPLPPEVELEPSVMVVPMEGDVGAAFVPDTYYGADRGMAAVAVPA